VFGGRSVRKFVRSFVVRSFVRSSFVRSFVRSSTVIDCGRVWGTVVGRVTTWQRRSDGTTLVTLLLHPLSLVVFLSSVFGLRLGVCGSSCSLRGRGTDCAVPFVGL